MHYDDYISPVNYNNENGFMMNVSDHIKLLKRYEQLYNLLLRYMPPEEIDNVLNKKGSA